MCIFAIKLKIYPFASAVDVYVYVAPKKMKNVRIFEFFPDSRPCGYVFELEFLCTYTGKSKIVYIFSALSDIRYYKDTLFVVTTKTNKV